MRAAASHERIRPALNAGSGTADGVARAAFEVVERQCALAPRRRFRRAACPVAACSTVFYEALAAARARRRPPTSTRVCASRPWSHTDGARAAAAAERSSAERGFGAPGAAAARARCWAMRGGAERAHRPAETSFPARARALRRTRGEQASIAAAEARAAVPVPSPGGINKMPVAADHVKKERAPGVLESLDQLRARERSGREARAPTSATPPSSSLLFARRSPRCSPPVVHPRTRASDGETARARRPTRARAQGLALGLRRSDKARRWQPKSTDFGPDVFERASPRARATLRTFFCDFLADDNRGNVRAARHRFDELPKEARYGALTNSHNTKFV